MTSSLSAPAATLTRMVSPLDLRFHPHVTITYVDNLPHGVHAMTNGVDRIWMRRTLLQVEWRCALKHELAHIVHGHRGHQPRAVEVAIRAVTARDLIAFPDLLDARKWSSQCVEMAEYLNVTPRVLRDRVAHLSGEEREAFGFDRHGER